MNNYQKIMICIGFIYVIFLIIFFTVRKKELVIRRMHGISVLKIVKDELFSLFVIEYVVFNIFFYFVGHVLTEGKLIYEKELIIRMCSISLYLLCVLIVISLIIILLVRYISDISILKRNGSGYKNIIFSIVLKIIILMLMTEPLFSIMLSSYESGISYYYMEKNKNTVSDLYYIDTNMFNGSDELVNHYLKNDGYYCDFHTYLYNTAEYLEKYFPDVDEDIREGQTFGYPAIFVNANYIEAHGYKITDKNGMVIDIHEFNKDKILVPSQYIHDNHDVILANGTQLQGDIEIIETGDTGTYVNYENDEPFTLRNPVIYLVTQRYWNVNMQNLYLKGNPHRISSDIKQFTDEDVPLISMNQRFNSNIVQIEEEFKSNAVLFVLYLIMFIGTIFQIVFWFVEEFKKLLMIEYILGRSRMERYLELFVMSSVVYIVPVIINILILDISFIDILYLYMASILFELLIIVVTIYRLEKNSVSVILKGESSI